MRAVVIVLGVASSGVTTSLAVGIYDHFGWAVAVTAGGAGAVVDRRRLELVAPGLSAAPVHYDAGSLDDTELSALIRRVRASVAEHAHAAFGALAAEMPGAITSIALRRWPDDFPTDLATVRRAPYESRADAVMYRQVLAEVATARGWAVHTYDAKQVIEQVEDRLGDAAGDVLTVPRRRLGPPWTKDHRVALAGAITGAASPRGPDAAAPGPRDSTPLPGANGRVVR